MQAETETAWATPMMDASAGISKSHIDALERCREIGASTVQKVRDWVVQDGLGIWFNTCLGGNTV